eukprot:4399644-Prymnesium_polylepis.1
MDTLSPARKLLAADDDGASPLAFPRDELFFSGMAANSRREAATSRSARRVGHARETSSAPGGWRGDGGADGHIPLDEEIHLPHRCEEARPSRYEARREPHATRREQRRKGQACTILARVMRV